MECHLRGEKAENGDIIFYEKCAKCFRVRTAGRRWLPRGGLERGPVARLVGPAGAGAVLPAVRDVCRLHRHHRLQGGRLPPVRPQGRGPGKGARRELLPVGRDDKR